MGFSLPPERGRDIAAGTVTLLKYVQEPETLSLIPKVKGGETEMRWLNIRTLLTIALSLLLASFGVYLGLQLPHMLGIPMLNIPSGEDLIKAVPAYQATTTVALALVGLLLGFYLGPRLGEIIVRAGRSLEMASAADKIAVAIGTALGVTGHLAVLQFAVHHSPSLCACSCWSLSALS